MAKIEFLVNVIALVGVCVCEHDVVDDKLIMEFYYVDCNITRMKDFENIIKKGLKMALF